MSVEKEFDQKQYDSDIQGLIDASNRITQMIREENSKDLIIKMLHIELKFIIGLFNSLLEYGYDPKRDRMLKELVENYKLRYIDNNPFGKEK
jgi:hypothetical protein